MTVVINGSTGISPVTAAGTSALVDGMTVGRGAGEVATNTAVGASALAANTSGASNTAIGNSSLISNTTASYNTAVGFESARAITSGQAHTALGNRALYSTTTSDYNVGIGYFAGYNTTTGGSNTALGSLALYSNTTASNNTAVGYQAGYTNTTSAYNVFIGWKAGYSHDFAGNGTNTFIGEEAGTSVTSGRLNTFIGGYSGGLMTTGTKNTIIGSFNGNAGGLDIRTASNWIVLSDGAGNPRGFFDASAYFYVPTAYTYTTASAANVNVNSNGAFTRSSSALKYKQDIRDLEELDISLLRAVRYKSKCENDDQTKDHLGLIADEAAEAGFEELVTRGADGEVEGFQYERLTVVLLKKLQVLEAEVKALKGQA